MKTIYNDNAKESYNYRRYSVNEVTHLVLMRETHYTEDTTTVGRGKYARTYLDIYCGFDIETYTTDTNNGYMYIWQFSINRCVIIGRTWEEFKQFIELLIDSLMLDHTHRLLVWIANASYEFQFMRHHINITDYFFKEKRQVLKFTHADCVDFQDCLPVSGGNLDYLARTYTNTQKCIGDLDYSIPRNSLTVLDDVELGYCCNDVLILSEWSMYYFNFYMKEQKQQPITMQSAIRKDLKSEGVKWFVGRGGSKKNFSKMISSCYPTEKTYKYIMSWCFRGGYTHGNILHVSDLMVNQGIMSYDFTSSYPSVMLKDYMPSRLYSVKDVSVNQYIELIKTKCVIATIEFTNIRATTCHSIESKSKCIELDGELIDNGRVRRASKMVACLTELDFRVYANFYEWDSMIIVNCLVSNRVALPDYVKKLIMRDYTAKAELKRQGKPYDVPKVRCNSYYGVCCSRLIEKNISLDDEGNYIETDADPYDEQIARTTILPQWSIYITAHARKHLLDTLHSVCKIDGHGGADALYMDTDSIKVKNCIDYLSIFELYNKREQKRNRAMCDKYNLDYSIFHDLGCFDYEGKCYFMKYWGAKRYVYTTIKKGKLKDVQTIAGLPKNTLPSLFTDRLKMYEAFTDDMYIYQSGKLSSYYNDEPTSEIITDEQGHTVVMSELSNIGLKPIDFTMTLDKLWAIYYLEYQQQYENKEKR